MTNFTAPDYPDIEIVIGAGGLSGDTSGTLRRMLGITDQFYNKVYKDIIGKVTFTSLISRTSLIQF